MEGHPMKISAKTVCALVLVLFACDCAHAGSIWSKRDKTMKRLYVDDVARGIGDTLTIKIIESSKVDNKGKRDLKKETARASNFDGKLNIDDVLPEIPGFTMNADGSNELKSKADFKDERSFEDRVSAVVIDVLPNGTLVVAGTRDRRIAGDTQTIEVSGLVRPSDIAFDNTVRSEQVANFRILTKNGGISAAYTQPGWFGRIFDILWPW
jgi:flagellar L-ring protein precursor FlgH